MGEGGQAAFPDPGSRARRARLTARPRGARRVWRWPLALVRVDGVVSAESVVECFSTPEGLPAFVDEVAATRPDLAAALTVEAIELGDEQPKQTAVESARIVALGLPRLLPLLDPRRPGGRGEDAGMAVVPPDSEAWRLLLEHLLDHASAHRLGNPLRLDDDQVSCVCRHSLLTSRARLEARL